MAVDAELVHELKNVKTQPRFFAFVAKGTEGKLLMAKAKVPAKSAAAAKKACGGGTLFRGRCVYEEDTLVFEVPVEPPGTLEALIKKIIKAEAALNMKVALRVNAALAEDEGSESESQEDAASPTAPAAPAAPPAAVDPRASQVMQRLNHMTPGIKAALAGPNKAKVQTLFLSVNGSIKSHDYAAADQFLDEMEPLIAVAAAPTASAAPPPPPPDAAHDAVMKRVNALSPAIKAAMAGPNKAKVQALFLAVNGSIKSHDYGAANKSLDELEQLLVGAQSMGESKPTATEGKFSVFKLGKARIEWGQVSAKAIADIGELAQLIRDEFADDAEQQTQLANAQKRIEGLIADLKDDLGDLLDQILNAGDDIQRKPFIDRAKAMAARLVQVVQNDPIMTKLDGNEIMPEMQVSAPLQAKLQDIAAALG